MRSLLQLCVLLLLALGASVPARAALADAEAAYRRGATLERSGDSEAALVEYQAALAHYPNYFYAYRQIGNCYMRLKQPAKALDAYDHYLAAKPTDTAVSDYAQRVRASLGAAPAAKAGADKDAHFYAGVVLSPVFFSVDDINALVPEGSTRASGGTAIGYGVEGGWAHPSGFFVQAGYFTGLSKSHTWKENSDLTSTTVKESLGAFYAGPGFRYRVPGGLPLSISGQLAVGLATFGFDYKSVMESGGTVLSETKFSSSASPMLILAQARADYRVWKSLDLGAGFGYQSVELSKIEGKDGNLKDAKGGDAKADFKGLRLDLAAHWSF